MTGAYPEEESEPATDPLPLTLERPGVGTIVVMTRRLITCRTRTGRDAAAPLSDGSLPMLSW